MILLIILVGIIVLIILPKGAIAGAAQLGGMMTVGFLLIFCISNWFYETVALAIVVAITVGCIKWVQRHD